MWKALYNFVKGVNDEKTVAYYNVFYYPIIVIEISLVLPKVFKK